MAWSPISLYPPQFELTTGIPANGYVLKAYQAGTSTNTPMATDSTGGTQVTSIALNADGYPSVSGNIVIPHIDRSFKLALYPTQAAADANTGAKWNPDNLTPITNVAFANGVLSKATDYTLTTSDEGKYIYYSGAGGVTLSLPTVASAGNGFNFLVENDTSGNVTIDPNGAEQINGATTYVLTPGQDTVVICNGTAWRAFDLVSRSGNNAFTGNNTHAGTETMVGKSFWTAEGADVASAATTDIWTTDGNTVHVTGTTTITSLGTAPQAGATKRVIFDGALILTHGANLNLPGAANITTVAGESCTVYADTTTQLDVFDYTDISVPPARAKLETVKTTTSGTTSDFTGVPAWVNEIHVSLVDVSSNGASPIILQLGTGAGFVVTGYVGGALSDGASSSLSTGFQFFPTAYSGAVNTFYGILILTRHSGNQWVAQSVIGRGDINNGAMMGGGILLAAVLTQLRLTTVGGTETFDAGSWNVRYKA